MVKLRFLGACREVGRSGILIESEESGDRILLDYGIKSDHTTIFPEHVSGRDLSAIVLSHSHIDHCGGIPLFYISGSVPLYCTELTYKVSEILLNDMLRINQQYLPFGRREIKKMHQYVQYLSYKKHKKIGKNSWITLYNAGHIPGSAMILVEMDGKRILYTGDFNLIQTQLLNPVNLSEIPPIDALIIESTYGLTSHPAREETEDELVSKVNEIVSNGGIALIPAFGVARSQEILMVLNKHNHIDYKITVDGMARAIISQYSNYPSMFRNFEELIHAFKSAHIINQYRKKIERSNAASNSGVIIAPSGMLKGGTARYYAENIINDPKNAIFLVSYQVENTPGQILLDTNKYQLNEHEKMIDIVAKVFHLDFSSHSGQTELLQFIDGIKFINQNQRDVFCVHGDEETLLGFAKEVENHGCNVYCPYINQKYSL
ncbi:MAG: MBL fold metallo-hydrolase [Candidatus Lokiarchaeota archaeon]|nr:MBL fold metallo-hydrolase [Candidatus Harpocratesius repetitus]